MGLEQPKPISGVDDPELVHALRDLANLPAPALEDRDRFASAVQAIIESRAQGGWAGEGESDLSLFVLTSYPRSAGDRFGAKPVCNLIAGGQLILGKVFFLSRDASRGMSMDLPAEADEIAEWLIANDLGESPVVFAYRGSKLIIQKTKGATNEITSTHKIRDIAPVVSIDEVGAALTLLHRKVLVTPVHCPRGVWEEGLAARYIPGEHPEKAIQYAVFLQLNAWFRGIVKAEPEDVITEGRIDVRLLRCQPDGTWVYWTIVELKLIKSLHNAKKPFSPTQVSMAENANAVAEGVRQAFYFGESCGAEALLEIYDLRKDKRPDVLKEKAVVEALKTCSKAPSCRNWRLYGSATAARRAGFA